ncbi:MAG: sensor histidine kinase [Candidatus Cloacimonetes bacterium]|nr:sensor histidine kinase [Candidatus Cloacimonadota bacterium]MCF7868229.1 sensor histidine kinase [Candidatus Cloacimonadota bacterium]MCF7883662.1 sensor histidine kinase [Candidatus Cloacimonadota bacterium]
MSFNRQKLPVDRFTLSFEPALEKKFQTDYFKSSVGLMRLSFILGFIYYTLFAILDIIALPEVMYALFMVRFAFVCPVILIVFVLSYRDDFARWWQFAAGLTSTVAGVGIVIMTILTPSLGRINYYPGAMLVLFYCYMLIKLRFIWATVSGWIIFTAYVLSIILFPGLNFKIQAINMFFLASANILGMFGGYALEYYTRKEFYFRAELNLERDKIKNINENLEMKIEEKTRVLQNDIVIRKSAEKQLHTKLEENKLLLRELYHRTKNNMQVIASMLKMQMRKTESKTQQKSYKEIVNKIYSMSLVHQKLYQKKNLSKINLKEYIEDFAEHLIKDYPDVSNRIELKFNINEVETSIDYAIPLGLVITELITNSLKHAFQERDSGEIRIFVDRLNEEILELSISDNGVGVPVDSDLKRSNSLGLKNVVNIIEYQLQGKISVEIKQGITWKIVVNDNTYKKRF